MLRRLRIRNLALIRNADLAFDGGITALTGETGAGKTIFAQAIGLLLGAKGDAGAVGPDGSEAYVEAEFDVPDDVYAEDEMAALAELRPADERGLVLARRVFADGRTRAYAWGRAVAREDAAAAAERLVAMSGQFEQRRLARASYQLDVLDRFAGTAQLERRAAARAAWGTLTAARRRYRALVVDADAEEARVAELRALVDATDGLEAGLEERLRRERERFLRVSDLAEGASAALAALAPEDGDGAETLVATARRSLAPLVHAAPELAAAASELDDLQSRLQSLGTDLHRFRLSLDLQPEQVDEVEAALERISDAKRRFRCATYDELIDRRVRATAELEALDGAGDPVEAARVELERAEAALDEIAGALAGARRAAAGVFADAVAAELADVGMGEGEFVAELGHRDLGPTGRDDVTFLIRPNRGMPFGPVAETASGGELSRIALAIAAVSGGGTIVFDEIDAGIGGVTAHGVADVLTRLAARSQVLVITHLPQIARKADRHYSVVKVSGDPTHTHIELLDDAGKAQELERMLGGEAFLAAVARS